MRGAIRRRRTEKWGGLYDKTWQAFAMVGGDLVTGVLGDERSLIL